MTRSKAKAFVDYTRSGPLEYLDERRARRWEAFARHAWGALKTERGRRHADAFERLVAAHARAAEALNDAAALRAELAALRGVEADVFDCAACGNYLGHATHCPCWFGSNKGKLGAGEVVRREPLRRARVALLGVLAVRGAQ